MEEQVIITEKGNAAVAGRRRRGRCPSPSPRPTLSPLPFLADLLEDGFGEHPFYHCLVAEVSKEHITPEGKPPSGSRNQRGPVLCKRSLPGRTADNTGFKLLRCGQK